MNFFADDRATDFTSAMAMTGNTLINNKNSVKKSPKVPMNIATSIMVGLYIDQLEGR